VVVMQTPPFQRWFSARELSDGTLQYLCLLTALMSPRPPGLMALNEPETSIHPELIGALAKMIVKAGEASQIWLTTHSVALAEEIERLSGVGAVRLEKVEGETRVAGQTSMERMFRV
jgi:predicted ATPase